MLLNLKLKKEMEFWWKKLILHISGCKLKRYNPGIKIQGISEICIIWYKSISSVYYLFFIGTAAVAINHFFVYQNLLWLVL
jgi:hypothetical protein